MKVFLISGTFRMGERTQPFSKEVLCENKVDGRERLLSVLGSKHKVQRRFIKIDKMEEVKPDDVKTLKIKQQLGV